MTEAKQPGDEVSPRRKSGGKILGAEHPDPSCYTKNLKLNLEYRKPHIVAYSDVNFAANRDDKTSMREQLLLFDNSLIAWKTFE